MPDTNTKRAMLVFVSSTFTDLAAEREHLAAHVFPRLRAACEARGVVFAAVDLRWGVPADGETAEEVVQICFDEIDRCRPFFIGLLGSRPGWSPGVVPRAVLANNPWLIDADRQTITELEFRYAALNPQRHTPHAWVYVSLHPSDEPRLDALRVELLEKLPERVRVGYASPQQLGEWVHDDFERLLEELFPAGTGEDPLARERELHSAYAATRSPFFVERGSELATLDAHARGSGPALVVTGESGLGKSALLARWLNRRVGRGAEVAVIAHFVGASPASGSWSATARRIVAELQRLVGTTEPIPDDDDDLRLALSRWIGRATTGGRTVVLVIDAVNQLVGGDHARSLRWLPPYLPPSFRLVVSTTQARAVEELRQRGWSALEVKPLSVEERARVATAYLDWCGKGRRPGVVPAVAAAPQAANPLFLVTLLDELSLLREGDLDRRLQSYLESRTPGELFGQVLQRHEADFGRDLVAGAMSALWAARSGLSDVEMVEFLGVEWTRWIRYRHGAGRMVVDLAGLVSFGHQHVRDAVKERYVMPGAEPALHAQLARYFCGGLNPGLVEPTARRTHELPWQLLHADDLAGLFDYLKAPTLFDATWKLSRQDGMAYWAAVESGGTHTKLEAYAAWMEHLEGHDAVTVESIADLLQHTTNPVEAVPLREHLVGHYRGQEQQQEALARALGNLAAVYGQVTDPRRALPLLEEGLELCRRLGERRELARCLYNLGHTYSTTSSLEEGERWVRESAQIREEIGDRHGLAESLGFLAFCRTQHAQPLVERGDWSQARPFLDEAKRLLDQAELCAERDEALLAKVHGTRGLVLRYLGAEPALILREYEAQRLAAEHQGDVAGMAIAIHNEATTRFLLGDLAAAARLFEEEAELSRGLGDVEGQLAAEAERGRVLFHLGQRDEGRELILRTQATALAGGRWNLVEGCRRLLAELEQ